jgi:hypothetical protein
VRLHQFDSIAEWIVDIDVVETFERLIIPHNGPELADHRRYATAHFRSNAAGRDS